MIAPTYIETKRIPPRNARDGEVSLGLAGNVMVRAVDHPLEMRKGPKTGDLEELPVGVWVRQEKPVRVTVRVHPALPPNISSRMDIAPLQHWGARSNCYSTECATVVTGGTVPIAYTDPYNSPII
jgi:hypothetical protein